MMGLDKNKCSAPLFVHLLLLYAVKAKGLSFLCNYYITISEAEV